MIVKEIPLDQIKPGRYQPRQEFDPEKLLDLATSIQEHSLLYPLLVFLDQDGKYELVGGERRWRASCALVLANLGEFNGGLPTAVAITAAPTWPEQVAAGNYPHLGVYKILINEQPADLSDEARRIRAVADNLQRADLTPFEEAQAIYDLKTQLNLSLRQIAGKVGKSKSWVEDRLKLMKLDPAAAQAISQAAADDKSPTLDMTVIREVARRLPEPLQKPALDALHALAGNTPTDQLKKIVADLGALSNPANWSVPSSFDDPAPPRAYNLGRLMVVILDSLPPETLVKRLMKLYAKESYNNYLGKKPAHLVQNEWDFNRVARTLLAAADSGDRAAAWLSLAPAQGWTCDHCLKGPLRDAIEHRERDFERTYETPCARLGIDAHAVTCLQFVQAGNNADAPVITVPAAIAATFAADSHEAKMMKPLVGATDKYVTTWPDYHHLYTAARLGRIEQQQQAQAAAATAHLKPLRDYWQAQLKTTHGLDIHDFQAHACYKCVNFDKARLPAHGTGCRFAVEPLGKPEQPKAPEFGVLVDPTGRPVPRCSKFRYAAAELPALTGAPDSFVADDAAREMLLAWYRLLVSRSDKRNLVFGVLNWLPTGAPNEATLPKIWERYPPAEALLLLHIGIREAIASEHNYTTKTLRLVAPNGQLTEWRPLEWQSFANREKHYNWGDWPLPWAVRQADEQAA